MIFANGVDTEGWTISPTEADEGATVNINYSGEHRVKSVTAKKTIGKSDFTTGCKGASSNAYQLNDGEKATFTFVNHTNKVENWHNFYAWVKNSANDDIMLLRADNWEDIRNGNAGIVNNYDWGTFRNDMDGATVVVTFKYYNGKVSVHADVTTTNSKKLFETASVDASGTVSVCMTIGDGCYLSDLTSEKSNYDKNIVGEEDNTTPYLGARTQKVGIEQGQTVTYRFTNYTSKGGNFTNFVAAASDASGEIMLLRADAWDNRQNNYAGGNAGITNNFDWNTFQDDMDGASVVLTYTYKSDGHLITRADITTASNKSYYMEYIYITTVTGTLTTWVTVERAHLVLSNVTTGTVPSLNITSPAVGQVIGSDGKNYDYESLPLGVHAVAKICYVNGNNGLALAMSDEGRMQWDAAVSTTAAHLAPINGTWKLAERNEWLNMINAAGDYAKLRNGFTIVGGTNLNMWGYWSNTDSESDTTEAYVINFQSGGQFTWYKNIGEGYDVRACLEF